MSAEIIRKARELGYKGFQILVINNAEDTGIEQ